MSVIKKRSDFLAMRGAPSVSAPGFLLIGRPNGANGAGARFGLTVTKKLGGASVRNRIRRRLRAVMRDILPRYARPGTDYVLIARSGAATRQYDALLDDAKRGLLSLGRKLK